MPSALAGIYYSFNFTCNLFNGVSPWEEALFWFLLPTHLEMISSLTKYPLWPSRFPGRYSLAMYIWFPSSWRISESSFCQHVILAEPWLFLFFSWHGVDKMQGLLKQLDFTLLWVWEGHLPPPSYFNSNSKCVYQKDSAGWWTPVLCSCS